MSGSSGIPTKHSAGVGTDTGLKRGFPENPPIGNQAVPAQPADLLLHLTHDQVKQIKLAQLAYAKAVSDAASATYVQMMAIINSV